MKRLLPFLAAALIAGCVSQPPPAPDPVAAVKPAVQVPAFLLPPKPSVTLKQGAISASIVPPPAPKTNALLSWTYPDGSNHLTAIYFKPDLASGWTLWTNIFGTNYQESISTAAGFYELAHTNGMVELAWNPSISTNVTGYKIYRGTASQTYTNALAVGNVTNVLVGPLAAGKTYFFAATAVDAIGDESPFSNEAAWTAATNVLTIQNFQLKLK